MKNVTKINLEEALKKTREQKSYLSIREIAEVINNVFEEEEIESLVKELTITASEDYPWGGMVEPNDFQTENEDELGPLV